VVTPRTATPEQTSTRDRIVETALRLFSERGTASVSVRDLAEAAGVTVPGLYYHFASKAELIQAVYQARGMGRTIDELRPDELPRPGPIETRIAEHARWSFDRLVEDEEFLRLMHREAVLGDSDALEVGRVMRERYRSRWQTVLGASSDVAKDVDLTAAADVIATFLWGLFVEYLNRRDATAAVRIDDFARMIAQSLRSGS
jgi:AcrR family transcriptional regulator